MIDLHTFYQTPESDKTLILIHAFPLSSKMWEKAAEIISVRSPQCNILFADLPGFGNAPEREYWTLAEEMEELHVQLQKQGIRNAVIGGLSMGGYAAFAYYRLYPKEVSALILSNTKPAADTTEAKKDREAFAIDAETRGAEAVYERLLPKLIAESSKTNPALILQLRQWIGTLTKKSIASCLRALAVRDDSNDLLQNISCPTLIITGEKDVIITPQDMEKFSSEIKDARFITMMEVGHLSVVERPEEWAEIASAFLNELS
jgi:3-oxoadipate enol-lactonase